MTEQQARQLTHGTRVHVQEATFDSGRKTFQNVQGIYKAWGTGLARVELDLVEPYLGSSHPFVWVRPEHMELV